MVNKNSVKVGDTLRTYWNVIVKVETIHENGVNIVVKQKDADTFCFDVQHRYEHLFPLSYKIF